MSSGPIGRRLLVLLLFAFFSTVLPPNDSFAISKVSPSPGLDPHAPPPPLPDNPPTAPPTPSPSGPSSQDRFRNFIGAYLHARSDPNVEAEAGFFAERVNYFDRPNVSREEIRRELARYRTRWPERQFTLAGGIETEVEPDGRLRLTFLLRYTLRNGPQHSSGETRQMLLLRGSGPNEFQILAINEKARP